MGTRFYLQVRKGDVAHANKTLSVYFCGVSDDGGSTPATKDQPCYSSHDRQLRLPDSSDPLEAVVVCYRDFSTLTRHTQSDEHSDQDSYTGCDRASNEYTHTYQHCNMDEHAYKHACPDRDWHPRHAG